MARPNIESAAAPAVQGTLENQIQAFAAALFVAAGIIAAVFPGAILGALAVVLWRWLRRPSPAAQTAVALAGVVVAYLTRSFLQPGWLWQDMLAQALPGSIKGVDASSTVQAVAIEVGLGPLLVGTVLLATILNRRTVGGQLRRDHHLDKRQWRAISGETSHLEQLRIMLTDRNNTTRAPGHPPGAIRLGLDTEIGRPFDLTLPDELAVHVFLPGASGAGKTTTIARLADGAIANSYGVIFIDCKGGDLGPTAREIAARHDLPFYLVDPDDPNSLGYNPCSGDAPSVANKLVGAFSYGPSAEIYKNIAMEAVPLVVRALMAAGDDVTLETLYDAFGPRGLAKLAQRIDGSDVQTERLRKRLRDISSSEADRVSKGGQAGLQRRLGALLEGKFGELFRTDDVLDWDDALAEPSVTYIALSTLASSEDVELFGRVIAQDLKQACSRRIKDIARGADPIPALAIFDEFAALREAEQLADLLVQARGARMPVVVSTQYIPEANNLRKAVLSAGLIISHRVESEDAQTIAGQFGTRKRSELTNQMDFETGYSEKGTVKRVDGYNVNPNIFRTLKVGHVALKSVARERHAIVYVYRDTE